MTLLGSEKRKNFASDRIAKAVDNNPDFYHMSILADKWSLVVTMLDLGMPYEEIGKLSFEDVAAIVAVRKYGNQQQDKERERMESRMNHGAQQ